MRVVHVGYSDGIGGAARATWRLHNAMVKLGLDSWMVVTNKVSGDIRVVGLNQRFFHRALRHLLRAPIQCLQAFHQRFHPVYSSLNVLPTGLISAAEELKPDVIHLHWVGANAASIEEIGAIRCPTVWTLRDMWAFCGANHYDQDLDSSVWRCGVQSLSQIWSPSRGDCIEKLTWLRKRRAWRRLPVHLVAISRWLADCANRSALFAGKQISMIPNTLDLDLFRPYDPIAVRQICGLPDARPIILFGADGGLRDPRKGGDLLSEALRQLPEKVLKKQPLFCVFGQSAPEQAPTLPIEVRFLGRINDDLRLAMLYAAADVMVIPSRLEALGQTGTEAQACGCPVVTFDSTGTADLVEHQVTGYLSTAGSSSSLAEGIGWALADPGRREMLRHRARERAERLWAPQCIVQQYTEVYAGLIAS